MPGIAPLLRNVILASAMASIPAMAWSAEEALFLAGADLSHLALMERSGVIYRDQGTVQDALTLVHAHGINLVRLRLWTCSEADAAADPYNHGNTLTAMVVLAQRVKSAGMQILLDLHYSDSWADPTHQAMPRAWIGMAPAELEERMRSYTRDAIAAFRTAGALPEYVQIGNETPMGLAWPAGKVDHAEGWATLARLIRAADLGISEAAGDHKPRTIIHLDRGGDWGTTQWFFDELITRQHVAFDIIGESYYPFWHGDLGTLTDCLGRCVERYGKPVLIAETAFPWRTAGADGKPLPPIAGIAPGPAGQVAFARSLGRILATLPGHAGLGICWWGAEYRPGCGYNTDGFDGRSFFDQDGQLLPVVGALGALALPRRAPLGAPAAGQATGDRQR
jgi:arabinogalactan endo-1,4-beta-galactosidase